MGYSICDCEMIRIKEELEAKLGIEGKDDPHNLLNNMVDARACYKPSERVRKKKRSTHFFSMAMLSECALLSITILNLS